MKAGLKAPRNREKRLDKAKQCQTCSLRFCLYEDALTSEIQKLDLISNLCQSSAQIEFISIRSIQEIGFAIQESLDREAIARWFFLRRKNPVLRSRNLRKEDVAVKAELMKLTRE